MGDILLDLTLLQTATTETTLIMLVYSALLSFVLSTLIAVTYEKTYRALSYSRNYIQALILISITSSMVMQAVGDSLARGFGIMAAMAVIRFRTNFKDAKDIVFVFASLAVGVACGTNGYDIAIVGTIAFCFTAFLLYQSPFGQSSFFDGLLRFSLENNENDKEILQKLLKKYCKNFALVTLRDMSQGNRLDYAYQIKLKKSVRQDEFLYELQGVKSIRGLSFLMQEATVEL